MKLITMRNLKSFMCCKRLRKRCESKRINFILKLPLKSELFSRGVVRGFGHASIHFNPPTFTDVTM